jgi:hypothetical protein
VEYGSYFELLRNVDNHLRGHKLSRYRKQQFQFPGHTKPYLLHDADLYFQVLLLEAGIEEPYVAAVPAFPPLLRESNIDWRYRTQPEELSCRALLNGGCSWARGKVRPPQFPGPQPLICVIICDVCSFRDLSRSSVIICDLSTVSETSAAHLCHL